MGEKKKKKALVLTSTTPMKTNREDDHRILSIFLKIQYHKIQKHHAENSEVVE